ncbi:MAG: SPFH domain-containing protein [Clostridiales bacterium]|nr:SPFH domain-containing protein [Clostridiales bacterium]
MSFLSLSTGAITAIAASAAAAAVVIIVAAIFLIRHKKPRLIDRPLDKDKIIEIYDVPEKMFNANVIIPVTHVALLEKDGAISTALSSGKFALLERGEKPDKIRIFFVSKTARIKARWGTQRHQRLNYRDPKIDMPVSVGAFGTTEIKISNANKFFQEIVPQGNVFTSEQLEDEIRSKTIDGLRRVLINTLNERRVSFYDFETERYDIQTLIGKALAEKFKFDYGIEVCEFCIENLNIAPEEEERIKNMQIEDSRLNRRDDLEDREYDRADVRDEREYARRRANKERRIADLDIDNTLYEDEKRRMRDEIEYERKLRHEDEDRDWKREEKIFDTNAHIAEKKIDAQRDVGVAAADAMATAEPGAVLKNAGHHCTVCGAAYDPASKYCPVCGATVSHPTDTVNCPNCFSSVPWGTTFCPHCGQSLRKTR